MGANQGHYGGYTQEHFIKLLDVLSTLEGKFMLSSYPNDALDGYRKRCKWYRKDIDMSLSVSNVKGKRKVECLTANYELKS